jgi:hypothetical protein
VLPLTLLFFFISCRDDVNTVAPSTEFVYENVPWNSKGKLLEKFGIGISKAMYSEQFRRLIRNEAIKRFNRDTDVLYTFVKDVPINSTAQMRTSDGGTEQMQFSTLHEFLVPFFGSEADLVAAEQRIPLLTIFVPTLPEDSFSPELWDVSDEEQIPDVALALDNISYVPVIGREGEKYLIEPGWFPGYPIVVLKENERVITDKSPRFDELDTRILNADGSSSGRIMEFRDDIDEFGGGISNGEWDVRYRFKDINFDGSGSRTGGTQDTNQGYRGVTDDFIPNYLRRAYDVFNNVPGSWQRDNIYYGLTPENTENEFVGGKYVETIATFQLTGGSPTNLYRSLSDSFHDPGNKDPQLQGHWQTRGETPFYEGAYEIAAEVTIGMKNSDAGKTEYKYITVDPEELFEIEWDRVEKRRLFYSKFEYKAKIVGTKMINTAVQGRRWEILTWDIGRYAYIWQVEFSERDVEFESNTKVTKGTKYAMNFEAAPKYDVVTKVGLKLGAKLEGSRTSEFSVKIKGDDDRLSTTTIAFYNNAINKVNGRYQLRKYNAPPVEFSFAPVQVEW